MKKFFLTVFIVCVAALVLLDYFYDGYAVKYKDVINEIEKLENAEYIKKYDIELMGSLNFMIYIKKDALTQAEIRKLGHGICETIERMIPYTPSPSATYGTIFDVWINDNGKTKFSPEYYCRDEKSIPHWTYSIE